VLQIETCSDWCQLHQDTCSCVCIHTSRSPDLGRSAMGCGNSLFAAVVYSRYDRV
jgi:hypothetical protein